MNYVFFETLIPMCTLMYERKMNITLFIQKSDCIEKQVCVVCSDTYLFTQRLAPLCAWL